jgi:signal transduction histidine kinase
MKQRFRNHQNAAWREQYMNEHRPHWWPENEAWPPADRRSWRRVGSHNPFFRRLGCIFVIFNFLGFIFFSAIVGLILNSLGIIRISTPEYQWYLPLVILLIMFGVGMAAFATRNLRRVSRPLDELTEASGKVAEGDFSARVEVKGPPEVRALLHGFNSMAEKLETNDKQRRAMLADVSHELRTPITVIQGNVEGMLDGMYPADETRLKSIIEETQILSRLVDDLRTLALAESGSLQLKREPTDLGLLIREVVSAYTSQVQEKEINVEFALAEMDEVEIDPQRVREVLSNLVSNALRYTPSQGVVKVGMAESTSGEERGVLVYVQDSGPGIESSDLSRIFERFYKSSDSGGMGLGLSIAKYLVEAHGGKIWAESDIVPAGETGQGTKISFTLTV